MRLISEWFRRTFDDPQVVLLVVVLLTAFLIALFFANILAPVIAAVVFAFLLDGPAEGLRRLGLSNTLAVVVVFVGFLAAGAVAIFLILPPLTGQLVQFFELMPEMLNSIQRALLKAPQAYPDLITVEQVLEIITGLRNQLVGIGQAAVQYTVVGLQGAITFAVYAILVVVMVFFFLKDKKQILSWMGGFLPEHRPLVDQVWSEVVQRTGDYVRGKVYEIVIVGVAAWVLYQLVGLSFATLLAVMTGLSVVIPYIGAAVVTLPVAFVAFFQWGLGPDFAIAVGAYLILQALDGNLLAPLLFSEVVKLHPNAIILAILVFGGIWGLWGVFFAIPLATLAHAVMKAWPSAADSAAAGDVQPKPAE